MTKLAELVKALEGLAHPSFQEDYDNSGLIVGDSDAAVRGVLVCLDSIESVIDEALARKCNVVVAHHPIVFQGLKKLSGNSYVERVLLKAIKNDIAIYAIHTNLDNVAHGVNKKICDKLDLHNPQILKKKVGSLLKLSVFVPKKNAESLRLALFDAGAGTIGKYDECSFNISGTGTFRGAEDSNPTIGKKGVREFAEEEKVEVLIEKHLLSKILQAMISAHPYEEVAYDIYPLLNENQQLGSGMIAELKESADEQKFLARVKESMLCSCIRHSPLLGNPVKKVAVCGGSGSFLLEDAKRAGAQVFISSDFKYHQFFDADGKILIADIGHFESEQFTLEIVRDFLVENFPNFGVHLTGASSNPVHYF